MNMSKDILFKEISIQIKEVEILDDKGEHSGWVLVANIRVVRHIRFSDDGEIRKQAIKILKASGYTIAKQSDWQLLPKVHRQLIDKRVVLPFIEIV